MNYSGKRIVVIDWETYFDRKIKYDIKSMSLTTYIRDSRFLPLGLAYRFLGSAETHWLDGLHTIAGWISSVDWGNTVVVAHNCKFDGSILAWRYDVKPFAWTDTVALAKAVLGENVSGYSLKRLAEYLGLPPKGEMTCEGIRTLTPQQSEELGVYCKNDVDIARAIYEKLIKQFPVSQLSAMDWTIRAFIEPRLLLSVPTLQTGVESEKKRREEIIKKSGIDKVVLSSNKQFAELLVQKGYTVPTKTSGRTGKQIPAFARTDDGLSKINGLDPGLYAARIASKSNLLETRGESLLAVAKTGSFPFDVGFSGAVQTHRYSGGSGAGGNPQNFTRSSFLRDAICAPEGYKLIVGDFAAIELRILAWLAKEPKLMGAIIQDRSVYCDFGKTFYGRNVYKNTIEYVFSKAAILGLGYNMGAKKFRLTAQQAFKKYKEECEKKNLSTTGLKTDISEDEAWKTVNLYRTTYFNVPKLWEQAHALLPLISSGKIGCIWFAPFLKVEKCAIILPSGLRILYPNLRQVGDEWVYDKYKKVYEAETVKLYGGKIIENICQALAGELCKEAIERAESNGLHCVGQVHDEVLAISRDSNASEILREAMERAPSWMPTLRLKSEVGVGTNWGNSKV